MPDLVCVFVKILFSFNETKRYSLREEAQRGFLHIHTLYLVCVFIKISFSFNETKR